MRISALNQWPSKVISLRGVSVAVYAVSDAQSAAVAEACPYVVPDLKLNPFGRPGENECVADTSKPEYRRRFDEREHTMAAAAAAIAVRLQLDDELSPAERIATLPAAERTAWLLRAALEMRAALSTNELRLVLKAAADAADFGQLESDAKKD